MSGGREDGDGGGTDREPGDAEPGAGGGVGAEPGEGGGVGAEPGEGGGVGAEPGEGGGVGAEPGAGGGVGAESGPGGSDDVEPGADPGPDDRGVDRDDGADGVGDPSEAVEMTAIEFDETDSVRNDADGRVPERLRAGLASLRARLDRVRRDDRARRLAIAGGFLVGLSVTSVHWVGLLLGGLLVGLPARRVRDALGFGLLLGILAWLGFLAWLVVQGAATGFVGLGLFAWLSLAIALGLPVLGSLIRGVV